MFGISAISLILDGAEVSSGLFKPCGTVTSALAFGLLVFDKWAWKLHWLHPWFVDRPYLKGTWKGVLHSTYVNPETQKGVPPIEVYLVVRQTYSSIHMRLITNESSSESLANNFPCGDDGVYQVASVYRNTPQIAHRDRSPIHHGAFLLKVEGDPVASLSGEYWTDRNTRGQLLLTEKTEIIYFDFNSAAAGCYAKPGSNTIAALPKANIGSQSAGASTDKTTS